MYTGTVVDYLAENSTSIIVNVILSVGFSLLASILLGPKLRVKGFFDKALEKYKAKYKKSIRNFDLYRSKKHEVYNKLVKMIYDILCDSSGFMEVNAIWQTWWFYDNRSDTQIYDFLKNLPGAAGNVWEEDIANIVESKKMNKEHLETSVLKFRNDSRINNLLILYAKLENYLLTHQLVCEKDIVIEIQNLIEDLKKLRDLYTIKPEDRFYRDSADLILTIKKKWQNIVKNMREELDGTKDNNI